MEARAPPDEVEELHETARACLAALQQSDGRATSRSLSRVIGESSNNVRYHLRENLIPAGFAEETGEMPSRDSPELAPTKIYALTEKGADAEVETSRPRDMEELSEEYARLREETQELRERVDELDTIVTQIADGLEQAGIAEVNRPE